MIIRKSKKKNDLYMIKKKGKIPPQMLIIILNYLDLNFEKFLMILIEAEVQLLILRDIYFFLRLLEFAAQYSLILILIFDLLFLSEYHLKFLVN